MNATALHQIESIHFFENNCIYYLEGSTQHEKLFHVIVDN